MSEETSKDTIVNISPRTNIQLSLLIALVAPLIAIAAMLFKLMLSVTEMKRDISETKDDIAELRETGGFYWSVQHQLIWADRLKGANTNIQIPSVQGVAEDLRRVR